LHSIIIIAVVYDGKKHISPGSIPKIKDRVVTISGYSKTFSITGWRIGYSVSNEKIAKLIGLASDLVYVCAPAPLQYGVANAIYNLKDNFYESLKNQYQVKRDKLCEVLQDLDLMPSIPEGAYYIMTDISRLPGITSKEKSMWLLNKTGVASVPGSAFYSKGGEGYARFCFAKDNDTIDRACEKLQAIKKLL
jgi:aminotransferase